MAVRGGDVSARLRSILAVLFLVTWAVGIWCCFREQDRVLEGPDPHASVDRVEWREIGSRLDGDRAVVYVSDYEIRGRVHGRFWRAQYALAPTIVLLRYNWKSAMASLEDAQARFLVAEFSLEPPTESRSRRIRKLREDAEARGLELSLERIGDDLLLAEVARGD